MNGILDVLGKIGFDWQVALANLINFLVIFLLLKKFAFPKIKKVLDERESKIKEGLENATLAQSDRMMADQEKNKIIKEAKTEASEILRNAGLQSLDILESAKERGQKEALEIIEKAKKEASMEIEKAKKEVTKYTTELVMLSVQKILQEDDGQMDEKLQNKIIGTLNSK